ncbi:MAG: hypothetical protein SP1CHLAM54_11700 [Chlamydiia bacterium]|nr:hypothetical protein [Chlamydiia bacterium]MCH9616073.1 hypothetical protein [Chlamydiia bacterium]MCH9629096.1 hypothetical protein [Chlamydiia bacterium]
MSTDASIQAQCTASAMLTFTCMEWLAYQGDLERAIYILAIDCLTFGSRNPEDFVTRVIAGEMVLETGRLITLLKKGPELLTRLLYLQTTGGALLDNDDLAPTARIDLSEELERLRATDVPGTVRAYFLGLQLLALAEYTTLKSNPLYLNDLDPPTPRPPRTAGALPLST